MSNGITADNLLRTLPSVLQNDTSMQALASSISSVLAARPVEIDLLRVYTQIDSLPEELLDILAYDFKIDWYDPTYMTLEEKRKTVKNSWRVHRTLGTKGAVESALSAIYENSEVVEWFDYDGDPFHFKIQIDANYEDIDQEKYARVISLVSFYKNLRSVLDEVEFLATGGTASEYIYTAAVGFELECSATAHNYH